MKKPNSADNPDPVTPARIHALPRKIARERGCVAAAVLRGLARKVQASENVRAGKRWYFDAIDTMAAEKWPYVPATTLYDTLKALRTAGLVMTSRNNKKSYDRTTWYSMPQEAINAAADDLVLFDVATAVQFGIEAALILHNLDFHLNKQAVEDPDADDYHHLSPSQLSRDLPMTRTMAKRKIRELEKAGKIVRREPKSPFWTIPIPPYPGGSTPNE